MLINNIFVSLVYDPACRLCNLYFFKYSANGAHMSLVLAEYQGLLIMTRLSLLIFFYPLQVLRQLPLIVRTAILLTISTYLVFAQKIPLPPHLSLHFFNFAAIEIINGFLLLSIFSLPIMGLHYFGTLLDNTLGIEAMSIFNPQLASQESILARWFNLLFILWIIQPTQIYLLLSLLTQQYMLLPLGTLAPLHHIGFFFNLLHHVLLFSLMLFLPLFGTMFCFEIATCILARQFPQSGAYFLMLPCKFLLGILSCLFYLGNKTLSFSWMLPHG